TPLSALQTATEQYTAAASDQTSAVVQDLAGNDLATLAASNLSAVPVLSGFMVSDSGSSNGSNRGKAGEAVSVLVNFSEAVSLSANASYSVHVQIGSSSADGFDASLVTGASAPAASSSYLFRGNLPASTGLTSQALTLTTLTIPSGKNISGSSGVLAQTSYTTLLSNSYIVDSSAPSLSIDTILPSDTFGNRLGLAAGVTATVVFNFSENPGSSFFWDGSRGDITVAGGTLSAIWGAGQQRFATFVPSPNTNQGVASISVAAGSYADAAGNAGAASSHSFGFDTGVPQTPTIRLGSGVADGASAAEAVQASGVVTVEAELGQGVTVRFVSAAASITKTITGQGMAVAVPVTWDPADLNQLGLTASNSITVTAAASDAAGNQSQSSNRFRYYKDLPAAADFFCTDTGLVFGDGISNQPFIQVEPTTGSTAFYTSNAGTTWTAVTGAGFYLATNTHYAANTVGVKTVDAAGNSRVSWITAPLTIDTIAPDAPTLTLQSGLGKSGNPAIARMTAESGSRVVVTFSDDTSPTPHAISKTLTGQGSATPVDATLAASDFGSGAAQLQDGTITVTAVATDIAGNGGAASSSQFARNNSGPALFIQSGQDAFVNNAENGVDVYVYSAALAVGDLLQFQLGAIPLGSIYTVTGNDVTAGRVALFISKTELRGGLVVGGVGADGPKTIRVNVSHSGSVSSTPALTLTLDTSAPLAPGLQLDRQVDNGASLADAIGSVSSSGVVYVGAESAARVAVTFTDTAGHRITKQVVGQGQDIPLAVALLADDIGNRADQLHDGTILITAIATDAAGNASSVGSSSFALYATAPAAPTLTLAAGVEGGATLAEASAATGVFSITGQSGSTAWLCFSDGLRTLNKTLLLTGGSDPVLLATSELGSGIAQLHDGTISVSAVLVDGAGNISLAANTRWVLDTETPLAPTLQAGSGVSGTASLAEALGSSGVVLVRAERAARVAVTFFDNSSPAHRVMKTVIGQGSDTPVPVTLLNTDLGSLTSQLQDGSISVSAIATDTAGNVSAAGSSSFALDSVADAPTLQLGSGVSDGANLVEATAATGVLSVLAESGGTVLISFRDSAGDTVTKTVPGTAAMQPVTLAETDLGVASRQLQDGIISVSAVLTDAAGNTSPMASSSFTLTADVLRLVLTPGSGVADGATLAEATASSGVLLVQGEAGNTISLTFSDSSSPAHTLVRRLTATGTDQAITLYASHLGSAARQLADGIIHVSASSSNGRRAKGLASTQFVLDTQVPVALTGSLSMTLSADTGTPGDFITSTHAQTITVHLNASLSSNDVLWGSLDGGAHWSNLNGFVSGTTLHWTGVNLLVGSNTLQLQVKDLAGNAGPVLEQVYLTGGLAPSLVLGAGVADGASRAEATASTGVVMVNAAAGSSVAVRFTDALNHSLTKTVTATGSSQPVALDSSDIGTGSKQLYNGQISVRVVASLNGGPDSEEATTSFWLYADMLALGSGVANGASAQEAVASSGVVTLFSASGDKVLVTFTDSATPTPHSRVKTITGNGAVQAVTLQASDIGTDAAGLLEGNISVTAVAYDAAQLANNTGSIGFTLDTLAPTSQVASLGIGLSADTGVVGDLITKTAAQTITASLGAALAAGETLWASLDGGNNWVDVSSSVSGTSVSLAAQTLLWGSHHLAFQVRDAAGNAGPTTTQPYTLDTTPPTAFVPGTTGLKMLSASHQYAVLPAQAAAISGDLSLEAWVFADGTPGQWTRIVDLTQETGFYELYNSVFLGFYGGKLAFSIYKESYFNGQLTADSNFPINSWHHVALTLSADKLATLYVDGVAVKTAVMQDLPLAVSRSRSFVGHSALETDPDFNGTIRDVRIYDNARTAAQISTDMAGTVDTSDANLTGYYPFSSSAASGKTGVAAAVLSGSPLFISPSLGFSSDTGVQGDFITSTQLQTITVHLNAAPQADEKVWGSLNNGSTWVDLGSYTSGNTVRWSNAILGTGPNTMQFEVRDLAGNAGPRIAQNYTTSTRLDTQVSGASMGLSADTGVAGDLITKTAAQTITATLNTALAAGETLRYRLDSGNTWTDVNAAAINGTRVSIPAQTLLSGSHNLEFQVGNVAGTLGPITSRSYTLDTTPPTAVVPGDKGLKLQSASHQYASLPASAVAVSGDLTLEAWVFADGAPGQWARIFDFSDGALSNLIIFGFDRGALFFQASNYGASSTPLRVNRSFPVNSWHHVAVTVRSDDWVTLYIDGQAEAAESLSDVVPAVTRERAFVGHSNYTGDPDFNGSIRDVRIYDDVRTLAEISSDMAGTVNTSDTNLIGYYPFTASNSASGKPGIPAATPVASPVITIPALTFSNDTGTQGDYITSTQAQTITAKLNAAPAAGEKVWGSLNNGSTWTDLGSFTSGDTVTWTGANLGSPGTRTLQLEVRDLAGNAGTLFTQQYTVL
ncbi:MAG: Ig-like domain-containing protein, partial [Rhodoferax sp.]|nr:Ig-like domain-containing protein [Rhodoferax sp.]